MKVEFNEQHFINEDNNMKKITEKELIELMFADDVQLIYNNYIKTVNGEERIVKTVKVIKYDYKYKEMEEDFNYRFGTDVINNLAFYSFNVNNLHKYAEEIGKLVKDCIEEKYDKLISNKVRYVASTEEFIYE